MTAGQKKLLSPDAINKHPVAGYAIAGVFAFGGMLGGFTFGDKVTKTELTRGVGLVAGLIGGAIIGIMVTNIVFKEK